MYQTVTLLEFFYFFYNIYKRSFNIICVIIAKEFLYELFCAIPQTNIKIFQLVIRAINRL